MTDPISIPNAKWWLNHSHVELKGLFLAEDEAWMQNSIVSVQGAGTADVSVQTRSGDLGTLKIQRMVASGTVAVMLRNGSTYSVQLPKDAGKLLSGDLAYITSQIDALSKPMTAEEQINFLKSAKAPSETNSIQES
jgi:hypothetical protein